MTVDKFNITLHMVSSLDGFIASEDGDVSWMESSDNFAQGVEDENAEDFLTSIDCFIVGSRTYELALALGWPYGDVPTIVLTHRNLPSYKRSIQFYCGNLTELVDSKLKPTYKNIWVAGGATVVNDFMRLGLANEISLSIIPVLLGNGIRFFDTKEVEQRLHLKNVTAYKSGIVELWYQIG